MFGFPLWKIPVTKVMEDEHTFVTSSRGRCSHVEGYVHDKCLLHLHSHIVRVLRIRRTL